VRGPARLAVGLLVGASACASSTAPPVTAPALPAEDVRTAVRAMADAIARDVSRDGPTGWLPYFAHTSGFFWASEGTVVIRDADGAERFVREFARGVPRVSLAWQDVRVDPVGPDAALLAAGCHEVLTDTAGKSTPWDGFFTGVAVRTAFGWQLRDGHWSSKPPPSADAAAADARQPCNPDFEDCSGGVAPAPPASAGSPSGVPPGIHSGKIEVFGALPLAAVRAVVEASFPVLRNCRGQATVPKRAPTGHVTVKFVIGRPGAVMMTAVVDTDLPEGFARCVAYAFDSLTFSPPSSGMVTVTYPLTFGAD
jgi:hypothetical protein